ncbi:YbaB/EbfC family nucleoid-associated protein [Prauserella muralis]|uniref:Uncharacterized protein n=1 Tax=Prauserella muralis TaxID=588067 RepID=A0A2V4B868_9PSEU|nr:YbaB/EbfC family nucleoid-associated protein [Prauserella muralis]PXY31251.1 hypothetical protein BAY60_02255 [Prauserella muralis]TWE14444.1 DNA-binding protein YbaB [Prauserella muralis]
MSAHMDQLIAQFERFQAKVRQAEARFAGVGDMQERIAQVEHSVTSQDGTVTVVAGAGGTVTDVRLTPAAMRLDPARLSATIMSTLRQAVAGAVQQQAGIVDSTFGDAFGVNITEQVRQAQAEALGTTTEEPPSQQEQPRHEAPRQPPAQPSPPSSRQAPPPPAPSRRRPSPPADDNDDYFDQNSILRR